MVNLVRITRTGGGETSLGSSRATGPTSRLFPPIAVLSWQRLSGQISVEAPVGEQRGVLAVGVVVRDQLYPARESERLVAWRGLDQQVSWQEGMVPAC